MSLDSSRLVHHMLSSIAEERPDATLVTFLTSDGEVSAELTRGEAWEQSRHVAGALRDAGIEMGDRVILMLGNQPEFIPAFFGTSAAGAVCVPLNTAVRGDVLRAMLEESDPAAVIVDAGHVPELAGCLDAVPGVRRIVVVGAAEDLDDPRAVAYDRFLAGAAPVDPVPVEPWDLAALLFTSGTTGRSKGVMCSHNMVVTWAEAAQWVAGYREDDIAFTCLPIYHGNGLCCTLLPTMLGRGRVALAPKFSASRFWRQVHASGATTTNLLGTMAAILWRQDTIPLEREHTLRMIWLVPFPSEYYQEFEERFNTRLTESYGLTDNAIPLGIPAGQRRPGSCGLPTPGWECRLVNEHDEPVPQGEVGALALRPRAPYVAMSGYWRRPDATVEAWRNLWFHTGDYLRQDEAGWYYFVDRQKDSIRRGGENISSWEIEQAVESHPAVVNAAAYGVRDEIMGQEVVVAVVLLPGEEVKPQELVEHCAPKLPKYAVPRYVRILERFPMTETEKIQKEDLRRAGTPAGTWDDKAQIVL